MGIPVDELQLRVSSHQFAEYYADFLLEPWGIEREDYRSGIVASTIANANRDPKKKRQPFTPDQFVPRFADREDDEDDELDEDEARAHAERIDQLMGDLGEGPSQESFMVRKGEGPPA